MLSFFAQASSQSHEQVWRQRLDLAWAGKGLFINLSEVPDQILDQMVGWVNQKIDQENEQNK